MNSLYVCEKVLRSPLGIVALFVAFIISATPVDAADVPQSFTLDGRLFSDAAGTSALVDSNIGFKIQILDDDQLCVLYEERQIVNTLSSQGYFSIQVGTATGDARRTAGDSGNTMAGVFQNISTVTGKLLSNGATCNVPPTGGKRRYVRIVISPSSMGGTDRVLAPNLTIDSVPNAVVAERAESLQGLRSTDVLKVNTASGSALSQSNLESLFTSTTRFNALSSVVDGTSTSYMRSNSSSGAQLPVITGAPTSPGTGSMWYDTVDQKLKYQTGSGPITLGTGGGSVTSVGLAAPSEISVSGGPITSSGSITIAWASQSANRVFASPNGSAGTPAFRSLVAADITGVVADAGTVPSIQSGLDAGKGSPDNTKIGRLYVAYDTAKIYRDSGTTWVVVSDSGGGGAPSGTASGDLSGSYPGPTVAKIQGFDVATTTPVDGQVLKYIGSATNKWTPSNFSIGDLKTAAGAQQFAGSTACTAAQTLTWSSLTDTFTCTNIALAGSAITSGTIAAARLPSSLNVPYSGAFQVNGTDLIKVLNGSAVAYSNLFVGSPTTTANVASAWGNTTLGMSAGDAITDGATNTLIGWNAGTSLTTASNNTYLGAGSGAPATTGDRNVGVGAYALGGVTTGYRNIGIGADAGQYVTSGNYNILIGDGVDASSPTASRELNIGDLLLGDLTSTSRKLDVNGALNQRGMAASAAGLSTAGQGRIYFDSTSNKFRVSQNGGAYVDLVQAASGGGDVLIGGNTVTGTMAVGTNSNHTFNLEQNNAVRLSILDGNAMVINGGTASAGNSIAMGGGTASGYKAFSYGDTAVASGGQSVSMGFETTAPSFNQVTVGTNNKVTGTEADSAWVATDPLFTIGNGTAWNAKSNALMLYKNGKMTLNGGTATPVAPDSYFDLNGDMSLRGMTAPAVSASGQGRIYFDSAAGKFKVSQNGAAYTDLVTASGGTVSGTTNRIPKFTSATAVGDSLIYDTGSGIGVGTTSLNAYLDINAAAVSGREAPMRFTVSDASGDAAGWKNSTVTASTFVPTFYGSVTSTAGQPNVVIQGMTTAANDTGTVPMVRFVAQTHNGDPVNGTFAAISTRPIFEFANLATPVFNILANGSVGINNATPTAAGLQVTKNGAASYSGLKVDGTWFSGGTTTTTKPYVLIEPAGTTSTNWSTAGTALGVNAASGFAGTFLDFKVNGDSYFSVNYTGAVTAHNAITLIANNGPALNYGPPDTRNTVGNTISEINAYGSDSNWNTFTGSSTLSTVTNVTDGSESVTYSVKTINAGTETTRLTIAGPQTSITGQINSTGNTNQTSNSPNINFNYGNALYVATSCTTFALSNMVDGGSYQLTVKGTSGTCAFTSSDTVHLAGGVANVTITAHTIFSFAKQGSDVYVTWVSF